MPERSMCDLSHKSLMPMDIGRLMCLSRMPVIAGDSFEFNSSFLFRLTQLRRPLITDIKMDVFVFYCPYRYTYTDWVSYIEAGTKEAFTFPTIARTEDDKLHFMLQGGAYALPKHIWSDAANIWNNYFRDPSWSELSLDTIPVDQTMQLYGLRCAHLKGWGTANNHLFNPADGEYQLNAAAPTISLWDIQEKQARARNLNFRSFMNSRYVEIMRAMSGSEPSDYSDNVPELVWQQDSWMSGFDINGTAGAELGASVGKGVGQVNLRMPRRLFTEHGTLYVFGLLRMPPMFVRSKQYLDDMNRPFNYVVPMESAPLPPVATTMADYFTSGGAGSAGYVPGHEWYREHPSHVHQIFHDADTGWQVLSPPANARQLTEVGAYDQMFVSLRNRMAIASCRHNITAWRPLPSSGESVMGAF